MENPMETKIAVIGIIIESKESVNMVNQILHQYSSCIIGRMGLPYEKKKISIISVVVDAPVDVISALSGKLGRTSRSPCQSPALQDSPKLRSTRA